MILSVEKQIYDTSQKPNKTSYETAIEAMQNAANAQDTADGKRRVFVIQPYPPYDVGDLWTDGTDLYVCRTARQTGSYASGDWVLATAYVTKSIVESDMETAVQKITGNLGGYVILHDSDDDGYPDELLIMNTDDITTATSVWRWNQQGLMWANSYTGQYATVAITADGKIVADAITTGTLRGIEIISTDGTNTIDLVNGRITTTGANGGKTITSGYEYAIYDSSSELMGKLTITYAGSTPLGAMLELDGKGKGWLTRILQNTLTMRDANADSTAVTLSGAGDGGNLTLNLASGATAAILKALGNYGYLQLYGNNGKLAVGLSASNGGIFRLYRYDSSSDTNSEQIIMYHSSLGGYLKLNWGDGTDKIYLGTLSHGSLMTDTPALAFYDTSGNIMSWYASNRGYIKDDTSGEEGYIVHGHSGSHGYSIDYTATGRIDFYVDTNYLGYATLAGSDARIKADIHSIEERYKKAISKVDLKNFHFDFDNETLSGANDLLRFGAIAQDVISALEEQGIDPKESELVDTVGDGNGERYVINYVPFLVARLASDEDRIQKLEDRLAKLEAKLEAM